jgi:hypothetical protein
VAIVCTAYCEIAFRHTVFYTLHIFLSIIRIISVKRVNQLAFVIEEDCVLCEVPTEVLYLI